MRLYQQLAHVWSVLLPISPSGMTTHVGPKTPWPSAHRVHARPRGSTAPVACMSQAAMFCGLVSTLNFLTTAGTRLAGSAERTSVPAFPSSWMSGKLSAQTWPAAAGLSVSVRGGEGVEGGLSHTLGKAVAHEMAGALGNGAVDPRQKRPVHRGGLSQGGGRRPRRRGSRLGTGAATAASGGG